MSSAGVHDDPPHAGPRPVPPGRAGGERPRAARPHAGVSSAAPAIVAYASAEALLPDSAVNGELVFWHANTLADRGRVDEAIPLFARAFAQDTGWATLLWRLPRVGLLHADSATIVREGRAGRR